MTTAISLRKNQDLVIGEEKAAVTNEDEDEPHIEGLKKQSDSVKVELLNIQVN